MITDDRAVNPRATRTARARRPRRGRGLVAAAATVLTALTAIMALGAWLPGLPVLGLAGTFVMGQYQVYIALGALVATALAVVAWRLGPRRTGRALTVLAALAAAGSLVVVGECLVLAHRLGAPISWAQVLTQLEQPGVRPDATVRYARVAGHDLLMDIYLPAVRSPAARPAVVWAHGGGFTSGDRADRKGTARWLAERGYPVFSVEYRMPRDTGTPTWDEEPQDLACALEWVRSHAADYHVTPGGIALAGESAGAALALTVAYRLSAHTMTSSCGAAPAPPAAVIGFYPVADLASAWNRDVLFNRRTARQSLGGSPAQYPGRYRAVSPIDQVRRGLMPTLLFVGSDDHIVGTDRVRALHDRLDAADVNNRLVVLPHSDHDFDQAYGSIGAQISRHVALGFLRRVHGS
jgi:acetyl esterase/lipase